MLFESDSDNAFVLTKALIISHNLAMMVRDAVRGRPVSGTKFPFQREIYGIFHHFAARDPHSRPETRDPQPEFPFVTNGKIIDAIGNWITALRESKLLVRPGLHQCYWA